MRSHYVISLIPEPKRRATIAAHGPGYLKSTVHAIIVTLRGIQHLYILSGSPAVAQLQLLDTSHEATIAYPLAYEESRRVLHTNILLAGYLASDLAHVLAAYPDLGGLDTVLHHLAFLACALVAGGFRLVPLMFGWLIVGEASTPLLNLRWLLIKSGRGGKMYFKYVEIAFAVIFVLTRFFLYGAGMIHQFWLVLYGAPVLAPRVPLAFVMGTVVVGFALNLVWTYKIIAIVRKPRRKGARQGEEREDEVEKERKIEELVNAETKENDVRATATASDKMD